MPRKKNNRKPKKKQSIGKKRMTNNSMELRERLEKKSLPKGAFYEPQDYWLATVNEFIDIHETDILEGIIEPTYIPYYIYALDKDRAKALTERFEMRDLPVLLIPDVGFVVFEHKTRSVVASFDELDQAKAFILRTAPQVKCFRTNRLGLKFGYGDYLDIPPVTAELSRQDWLDYFLNKENDYGVSLKSIESKVTVMLEQLVAYGAPQAIFDNYIEYDYSSFDEYSHEDLAEAFAYLDAQSLTSYKIGLEIATDFEHLYTRIWRE